MRLTTTIAGAFLAVSTASVHSSVNQSQDFNERLMELQKKGLAEAHATCAADLSIAAPYIKGRNPSNAVLYHRDRAVALMGKEFFASAYGSAYEQRIDLLESAHQKSNTAEASQNHELQSAVKSFAKDVEGCLNQVPTPFGME